MNKSDVETESSYVLKQSFASILVVLAVVAFGVFYVSKYLPLLFLPGWSPVILRILQAVLAVLFLLAIWNMLRPAMGHYPLRLTRQGFSVYNSGEISWKEVSDIAIERGAKGGYRLEIYLTAQSIAATRKRFFGKVLNPPRISLLLESTRWDQNELQEKLAQYAVQDRDGHPAITLRLYDHRTGKTTLLAESEKRQAA